MILVFKLSLVSEVSPFSRMISYVNLTSPRMTCRRFASPQSQASTSKGKVLSTIFYTSALCPASEETVLSMNGGFLGLGTSTNPATQGWVSIPSVCLLQGLRDMHSSRVRILARVDCTHDAQKSTARSSPHCDHPPRRRRTCRPQCPRNLPSIPQKAKARQRIRNS